VRRAAISAVADDLRGRSATRGGVVAGQREVANKASLSHDHDLAVPLYSDSIASCRAGDPSERANMSGHPARMDIYVSRDGLLSITARVATIQL
jgi:hypothetical protein